MLYALGNPVSLLLLLLSFVIAITLHGVVQAVVASRSGEHRPAAEGRISVDPRRHVDPFGAVAAAIGGIGWATPVDAPDRRRRGALVAILLSGAVANLVVGLVALVGFRLAGGPPLDGPSAALLQRGVPPELLDLPLRALLLFGLSNLFVGLLSLVPLPPLDGGRLLFALAPPTPGWQKAELQLVERNIGVAVLLALLLIPLGGPQALLPTLLDILAGPLIRLVTGG